ncbi:hypothetical protein GCM10007857_85860 [Bradyrhizobium iriomotense]|uniref:Uncharacterized protein n=1 Tax=Bradyrhizobium iriomotense TaxID=441950 RepID=A0ABQ6BIB0_9BRAD|nr:hypothetical protein GCM10007857_85860 [Bradyrhizobium iriomotense]
MLIGARITKQGNARELLIFDKKLCDLVVGSSGNGLQSGRSVEVDNGGDFVPPF